MLNLTPDIKFKRAYIEITNSCNLACSFCPKTSRKKRFMSTGEFETVLKKLRPYTGYIYLHVMGEPLLHPELESFLKIAEALDFKTNITTNGTLLKEKSGILLKYPSIRKVSVSLHSFEGNEKSRELLFSYLDEILDFAGKADCIVALRLWNEGGSNEYNSMILDHLSERTGLDVRSLPSDANGKRLGGKLYLESAGMFYWPIETLESESIDPSVNIRSIPSDHEKKPVTFCHGLSQQIAVLSDGTVVPCCLDSEGTISLGNIFESELCDILSSERAVSLIRGFVNHMPSEELCKNCDYASRF